MRTREQMARDQADMERVLIGTALTFACPTCKSPPDKACTGRDGLLAEVPCRSRLELAFKKVKRRLR